MLFRSILTRLPGQVLARPEPDFEPYGPNGRILKQRLRRKLPAVFSQRYCKPGEERVDQRLPASA